MSFRDRLNADGKVRIWDIPAAKWRLAYPVDAREMLDKGTATYDAPEGAELSVSNTEKTDVRGAPIPNPGRGPINRDPNDPNAPFDPNAPHDRGEPHPNDPAARAADPVAVLRGMEHAQLVTVANQYRVANPDKLGKDALIEQIAKKAGYKHPSIKA